MAGELDWEDLVLTGLALLACLPAMLAYSGRYRNFARQLPVFQAVSRRNVWPFTSGALGAFFLTALCRRALDVTADGTPVLWGVFRVLLGLFGGLVVVSLFTWPRFLSPRWYRDWLDRGGTRDTSVFSPEEHRAGRAKDLPPVHDSGREGGWVVRKILGDRERRR